MFAVGPTRCQSLAMYAQSKASAQWVYESSCCVISLADLVSGMATVQSDIFKPTKFGGKYTVTLIPGPLLAHDSVIVAV